MEWDVGDSVGADLCVCPEAAGARDRGRHTGLPLRPIPFPYHPSWIAPLLFAALAALEFSRGFPTHGKQAKHLASRQRRLNSGVADATRKIFRAFPALETPG